MVGTRTSLSRCDLSSGRWYRWYQPVPVPVGIAVLVPRYRTASAGTGTSQGTGSLIPREHEAQATALPVHATPRDASAQGAIRAGDSGLFRSPVEGPFRRAERRSRLCLRPDLRSFAYGSLGVRSRHRAE